MIITKILLKSDSEFWFMFNIDDWSFEIDLFSIRRDSAASKQKKKEKEKYCQIEV